LGNKLFHYDLLPVAALNQAGWLVDKINPRWVNITDSGNFTQDIIVHASLTADGAISGWFASTDEGYSALFNRRTLRDKKEDEYIRDGWLKSFAGIAEKHHDEPAE
jgi:hypothetical protein